MIGEAGDTTMPKEITAQPYLEMDIRDEGQILAEMKGEFLSNYVYSFKQGNRDITNLSYAGVKEAIRRRGHVHIIEQSVEEVNGKIRATVKVHDLVNDIDVLGASEAESDKPFAYVLAINKAERNAFAKIIPAKFFAELIAEKLGKKPAPIQMVKHVESKPQAANTSRDINIPLEFQLREALGEVVCENIKFENKDGVLYMTPKQRFETDEFKNICRVVEGFGGCWVPVNGWWEIKQP